MSADGVIVSLHDVTSGAIKFALAYLKILDALKDEPYSADTEQLLQAIPNQAEDSSEVLSMAIPDALAGFNREL